MKRFLSMMLPVAAAIVLATSCSKDKDDNSNVVNPTPDNPTPEVVTSTTSSVQMSFKVNTSDGLSKIGIASDNGKLGITLKFDGDEKIEFADAGNLVTGSVTLTAANLKDDGKTAEFEVTFEGEDDNIEKFKSGDITLTATIGSPLADITPTSYTSLEEAMRANSYQVSKDAITFSESKSTITFVEQTAYLEIGLPVSNTTVKVNGNDYSLTLGRGWIALPVGTKVTSTELSLDEKEVTAAKIYTIHRQYFSVSDTKKVHFSTGNLQYNVRTNEWRFAENQYDKCYFSNTSVGDNYIYLANGYASDGLCEEGWNDLFGWGTWLEDQTPTNTAFDDENYFKNLATDGELLAGAAAIGSSWNILSQSEWNYLFNTRKDAAQKYGIATVNDVNGIVILPDNWTSPEGIDFTPGMSDTYGKTHYVDKGNTYTPEQWATLESAGAVFLPTTGCRTQYSSYTNYVMSQKSAAYYWSSTSAGYYDLTKDESYDASRYDADSFGNTDWYYTYEMQFTSNGVYTNSKSRRHYGDAVRLVRDLEGSASTTYKFNFGGLTNDIEDEW